MKKLCRFQRLTNKVNSIDEEQSSEVKELMREEGKGFFSYVNTQLQKYE